MSKFFRRILVFSVLVMLCISFGCANRTPTEDHFISIVTPDPNDHSEEISAILKRSTFLEGVRVNGISIGGKTMEEARTLLADSITELCNAHSVEAHCEDSVFVFSGKEIAMKNDLETILNDAFQLARTDIGYDALIAEVDTIRTQGKEYTVTVTFDEASLREAITSYAAERSVPAVDATVIFDSESNAIRFTEEQVGHAVDEEKLFTDVFSCTDGSPVNVVLTEVAPVLTKEKLESEFVLRASFTTSFKGSTSNRKYNIKKGAGMMTGTVLQPGDVFSCNDTLGVRTKSNGWKAAGAYIGGVVEDQAGGGVCQLSSTLYNAVVMADLEIVDRRNHSMPVSYVKKGLDATINSVGNIIDFKFRNNTDDLVILIAYTEGNNLTMELYGKPFANDEYDEIRLRAEKIKTIKPDGEMEYELDPGKPVGYEELVQERRNGYIYQSYKQYYKNGELVREEPLAESTYRAYRGTTLVGPSPSPTPVVTPPPATEKPEDPVVTPEPQPDPEPDPDPEQPENP